MNEKEIVKICFEIFKICLLNFLGFQMLSLFPGDVICFTRLKLKRTSKSLNIGKTKNYAECEARTHDLQIMRLTRYQLR